MGIFIQSHWRKVLFPALKIYRVHDFHEDWEILTFDMYAQTNNRDWLLNVLWWYVNSILFSSHSIQTHVQNFLWKQQGKVPTPYRYWSRRISKRRQIYYETRAEIYDQRMFQIGFDSSACSGMIFQTSLFKALNVLGTRLSYLKGSLASYGISLSRFYALDIPPQSLPKWEQPLTRIWNVDDLITTQLIVSPQSKPFTFLALFMESHWTYTHLCMCTTDSFGQF